MPIFYHNKIAFYYEQTGAGPAVVFCHGMTGDLTQMRDLLDDLPGHWLIFWDARGHGRTEPLGPAEALTFPHFAADLRALLMELRIGRAVVGGVSMGAGVATRLALDWPELVSGLVLVRPAWLDRSAPEPLAVGQQIGNLLENFGTTEGRRRFENSREYERLQAIDPEAAQAFCEQFDKPMAAERCARLQRIPNSCPIHSWDEILQLRMPALVIGCESDYVHPYSYAAEWSRRLPYASLVKVPPKTTEASQHNQAVRRALRSFLNASEVRRRLIVAKTVETMGDR